MSNKSILKTTGEVASAIIYIKGLMALIPIIAILFVIALINKGIVSSSVDKNTSILYTDLENEIISIASNVANTGEIIVKPGDNNSGGVREYTAELEYMFINKNYIAEQYETLIKEEITKIYNKIKDKTVVDDTLFGDKNDVRATIHFSISFDGNYSTWLGSVDFCYSTDNGWKKDYQEIMESIIISQEKLDKVKQNLN